MESCGPAALSLIVSSVGFALVAGVAFLAVEIVYFVVTNLYSSVLKKRLIADVVTLALLYSIRVLAGCAVLGVWPTIWLVAFCVFVFFSLAVMKRVAELVNHDVRNSSRAYTADDGPVLLALGTAAAMVAVLVVALYIDSDEVKRLYSVPEMLWLTIPLIIYWLSRAWVITARGRMDDDPVVFTIRDRASLLTVVAVGAVAVCAALLPATAA